MNLAYRNRDHVGIQEGSVRLTEVYSCRREANLSDCYSTCILLAHYLPPNCTLVLSKQPNLFRRHSRRPAYTMIFNCIAVAENCQDYNTMWTHLRDRLSYRRYRYIFIARIMVYTYSCLVEPCIVPGLNEASLAIYFGSGFVCVPV